ncbi:MAG: hypothetical protein AAF968_14475, partial [Pseudomonadota bacterium]
AYARHDDEAMARVFSSMVALLSGACVAFGLLGAVFVWQMENLLNIAPDLVFDAKVMMSLLVVSVSAQMWSLPLSTGYHVRQRFVELNLLKLGREVIRIVLILAFFQVLGVAVLWVVLATVIAEITFVIVRTVRGMGLLPELRYSSGLVEWSMMKDLMSFGSWTAVGKLGYLLFLNTGTIVLNLVGTPTEVSSYYIGSTLFRQMQMMIQTALQPLQPAVVSITAIEDWDNLRRWSSRAGRYALWAAMAVAAPFAIFAEEFVQLYAGPDYMSAAWVILAFMMVYPFTQPVMLLPSIAVGLAKVREFFLAAFLFQLSGLLGVMFFVQFFERADVVIAVTLALVIVVSQLGYFWRLFIRLTDTPFDAFLRDVLVPGLAPAAAAAMAWIALKEWQPAETWPQLAALVVAGGVVYLAVLGLLCLREDDRATLVAGIRAMRRKFAAPA